MVYVNLYLRINPIFVSFALLLPVGQWVYDKSRVHINLKHPTGCIRCTCCIKDLKQQSPQGYSCHSPYSCSSSKRLQV